MPMTGFSDFNGSLNMAVVIAVLAVALAVAMRRKGASQVSTITPT